MEFFKKLIQKITMPLQKRITNNFIKKSKPFRGRIIFLEEKKKSKFFYKVIVKDDFNRTLMINIKNKVRLKKGDRIQGYYNKDKVAIVEVA